MRTALIVTLVLLVACASPEKLHDSTQGAVVLSWNISGNAFAAHPDAFKAILGYAAPDIVLLDEVDPQTRPEQLRRVLPSPGAPSSQASSNGAWHISFGMSGGRQRGVIASRYSIEELAEFTSIVPYPDDARQLIALRMSAQDRASYESRMDDGIAVNGAVVRADGKRLLVVIADLECCGNCPASWAELKRRVEAKAIRHLIQQVLERRRVDGIVLAGDFNLVSTPIPLVVMSGPYARPHSGLIAAEVYHEDGIASWTWDGRGTAFPSRALDYQLYSPSALIVERSVILDTEDLTDTELGNNGLTPNTSKMLTNHRPLIVEYSWQ